VSTLFDTATNLLGADDHALVVKYGSSGHSEFASKVVASAVSWANTGTKEPKQEYTTNKNNESSQSIFFINQHAI